MLRKEEHSGFSCEAEKCPRVSQKGGDLVPSGLSRYGIDKLIPTNESCLTTLTFIPLSSNVIFQAIVVPGNPDGCWDWWGFSGKDFDTKEGAQVSTVVAMVADLEGAVKAGGI